jgi:cobalamin-dependent methionine synthase I
LSLLAPAPAVVVRRSQKQPVGYQSVDVGVEIKVFAKGVQRHDDARNALRAVQGGAEVFAEAFVGQGAEALKQVAVALEVGAQHSRNSQDIMPVRHRGQGGSKV